MYKIRKYFRKDKKSPNKQRGNMDPHTQFIRNVSHRMKIDSMTKFSPSSYELSTIPGHSIPEFVGKLFDIGNEYNEKMKSVTEYAKVCTGQFVSIEAPLLVRNVISNATVTSKRLMKNISGVNPTIYIHIDTNVPISEIIADGPAITGILQELIYNGLRHSLDDEVTLKVFCDEFDSNKLYFTVENTGILVDPSDIPTIFEPFILTSKSEDCVRERGLGLGLAKSKKTAELIGGGIKVETNGTTMFTIWVPFSYDKKLSFNTRPLDLDDRKRRSLSNYEDSDGESMCSVDRDMDGGIRVLVVDDSIMMLKVFNRMMSKIDIEVETCSDPLIALNKIVSCKYDAIFLDVIMPVMTGIMCAHHIRDGDSINKNTPIIVVTADVSTETRKLTSYIPNSLLLEKPAILSVITRSLISVIPDKEKTEYLKEHCK